MEDSTLLPTPQQSHPGLEAEAKAWLPLPYPFVTMHLPHTAAWLPHILSLSSTSLVQSTHLVVQMCSQATTPASKSHGGRAPGAAVGITPLR